MQISLRDLIIPLLGSQTWPAGLFQGPPLQVCFHYSQLRITIPGSLLWNVFQQLLCFSIIHNLKSVIYWISSIVFVSTTTAAIFRHWGFLSNISLYISTTAGVFEPFSTSEVPFLGSLQSGKSHHCLGQSPCSCDVYMTALHHGTKMDSPICRGGLQRAGGEMLLFANIRYHGSSDRTQVPPGTLPLSPPTPLGTDRGPYFKQEKTTQRCQ